jgi:hypothetical protein
MVSEGTQKKNSLFVDDDEKHPEVPRYGSPLEELRATFRAATGGVEIRFQDECWLKEEMELRRVPPEGLLELLRKNPLNGFRSPMAGLKWLVKKFRTKTRFSLTFSVSCPWPFPWPVHPPACPGNGSVA